MARKKSNSQSTRGALNNHTELLIASAVALVRCSECPFFVLPNGRIKMKNVKSEKFCMVCFRTIAESENVAHKVNPVNNDDVQSICCMECFSSMEEVPDDYC